MIARFVARRIAVQGLVWGSVFALFTYTSAVGYAASYPSAQSRVVFARALGTNSGLTMLLGRAHRIDTIAGFTEWRGVGLLALVGGTWGVLTATRMLRGEEESGRWELLASGPVTRRQATVHAVAGLSVGWLALTVPTALGAVLTERATHLGTSLVDGLAYALAVTSSAAVYLAIGTLTSQLAHTRRHAAMAGAAVLAVSVVLRMLADSGSSLHRLAWLTPLGWIEKTQPLTGVRWIWFVMPAALTVGTVTMAALLAGRRDVATGVLERSDTARARTRWLGGPSGLIVRTSRGVVLGWVLGLSALGLLFGLVAKAAADAVSASADFRRTLAQLGGHRGGAAAYLGVTFLVGATLLMLLAAGRVVDLRDEEGSGRADLLLVRPLSRTGWFVRELAFTVLACGVAAFALAAAEYAGTTIQHSGVGFWRLMEAGVNVLPVAVVLTGIGALTSGLAPRRTALFVYGVVAWSFLMNFVAQLVSSLHWLRGTSLLYHMSPAPAADANWVSGVVLVAIGAAAAAVGTAAFARRDVAMH